MKAPQRASWGTWGKAGNCRAGAARYHHRLGQKYPELPLFLLALNSSLFQTLKLSGLESGLRFFHAHPNGGNRGFRLRFMHMPE